MNLLSVISQIKEAVSPLPLFFEGEVIDSEDSAVGCLYLSGETIVNKCYNPNGYLLFQLVITSCNLTDIIEYWCKVKPRLLEVYGLYDIQTLSGNGYKVAGYQVDDDQYEMIIKFKIRN